MFKRILYILLSAALLYIIFMICIGNTDTDFHLHDTYFVIRPKFIVKLMFVSMLIPITIFTFRKSLRKTNNSKSN